MKNKRAIERAERKLAKLKERADARELELVKAENEVLKERYRGAATDDFRIANGPILALIGYLENLIDRELRDKEKAVKTEVERKLNLRYRRWSDLAKS